MDTAKVFPIVDVPSPLPSSIVTVLPEFATAISRLASPLDLSTANHGLPRQRIASRIDRAGLEVAVPLPRETLT